MPLISIYITFPTEEEAIEVSETLLTEHLVACANISRAGSYYWWKGEIAKESEWIAILKSTKERWSEILDRVSHLHSYEIPCIIKYEIEANETYESWVLGELERGSNQ